LLTCGGARGHDRQVELTYDDGLRARLQANLDRHEPRDHALEGRRFAAVALVVVDSDAHDEAGLGSRRHDGGADLEPDPSLLGGPAVLLTKRPARMNRHAGQWALPGGRVDDGETAEAAVLREVHEELGLPLGPGVVLGRLDDYPTRSGYVIRPFVLWGGAWPQLNPAPDEVAGVYRVGWRELCWAGPPREISIPESDRPVLQLPFRGRLIHAPTAAVLLQFRLVALEGGDGRVDHYDQPVFAWR
jgi:8-oxo-dGTP pyrophosphatase MutT (NUDIX family)